MVYETTLYHYGVKGMKWGVRRYRNTDGSLTPAGKKRYGMTGDSSRAQKNIKTEDRESLKKRIRSLGDNPGAHTKALIKDQERVDNAIEKTNTAMNARKKELVDRYAKDHNITDEREITDLYLYADIHKDLSKILASDKTTTNLVKKFRTLCDEGERFYEDGTWNSALVKDLGYEDTQEARDYIEELIYG